MFKLNYFSENLSPGFVALFSGRMVQFVATELIGLFLPIFLLTKFNLIVEKVFLYYLVGHLVYAVTIPWGAQVLNKIGLRRSLRLSIIFDALFYVCLLLFNYNLELFVFLSLVFITLARTCFWLPYHTDFAKFTNPADRGKEYGLMGATKSLLDIIMPFVAGILITFFGFKIVFVLAIIIMLLSIIPFLALPSTHENFSWNYRETFRQIFSRENRKIVLANMANGAENGVGIIIWPIFIFQVLHGSYLAIGSLSSLIVLAAILLQLVMGKYTDIIDKRKLIHWGSVFYAFGWFVKMFVLTAFQIFIAGTYHTLVQIFKDTPFDTLNYQLMADHGHYVDEYTVIKEFSINFGKVLMLVFAILIASAFGLTWTFALAAIASLAINIV